MTMVAGPAGHIGITLASAGMGSQVNAIDAVAAPPSLSRDHAAALGRQPLEQVDDRPGSGQLVHGADGSGRFGSLLEEVGVHR